MNYTLQLALFKRLLLLSVLWITVTAAAQPGTLDPSFSPATGANGAVSALAVQGDGKILIGGFFTTYNGVARNYIARLNADGTLDNSFDPGAGANSAVSTLTLQSDGKVLIGGFFTTYNGVARNYIARLNADGTLDSSFDPGAGANNATYAIALQSDGRILIGGFFTTYNGTARTRVARLNADGTLDNSFDPGAGANNGVATLALQSNGKVLIGGFFTTYNGTARNRVARLNADGTLDSSFDPGAGANTVVSTLALQGDGKILIGGSFTAYNGVARNYIARLNADGTLDSSFDPGAGANNGVAALALQSDGKVLIGGSFTTYNGVARNRIARLNADGTLDNSFDPGAGANANVATLALQSNGRILIGGGFTTYNGVARNYIARLLNSSVGLPVRLLSFEGFLNSEAKAVLRWSVTDEQKLWRYEVESSKDGRSFETVGTVAATRSTAYQWQDARPLTGKTYYRLRQVDMDGKFAYSSVVPLAVKPWKGITVYPNPVTTTLSLGLNESGSWTVLVYDNAGRLVKRQGITAGSSVPAIDVRSLPRGTYRLTLQKGEQRYTASFLKNETK